MVCCSIYAAIWLIVQNKLWQDHYRHYHFDQENIKRRYDICIKRLIFTDYSKTLSGMKAGMDSEQSGLNGSCKFACWLYRIFSEQQSRFLEIGRDFVSEQGHTMLHKKNSVLVNFEMADGYAKKRCESELQEQGAQQSSSLLPRRRVGQKQTCYGAVSNGNISIREHVRRLGIPVKDFCFNCV